MIRTASSVLTPLQDALALLCGTVVPVKPQRVALAAARNRIAAGSVAAPRGLPEDLSALRDGFAVDAAFVGGASSYTPIPLTSPPCWVEAGERLPAGTNAVLLPEDFVDGAVVADVATREGVRAAGEEIGVGEALLAAGALIGPVQLLGLAAASLETVEVRLPRIRIVVAGAHAPDTLSPLLVRLIEDQGGTADVATACGGVEEIAEAIRGDAADAVFVLGGSGFGRTDHSAAALAHAGELWAHGIALRPGETAAIGTATDRPVLLLPGRPEAALAVFLTLGRPLLARLTCSVDRPVRPEPLLRKIVSVIGLTEVVFVRRRPDGVEPLGGAELPMRRLVEADGAVVVPPEREGYPAGAEVEVWSM